MNKRRLLSLYPLNLNEALTDLMKVTPKVAKKKAARKPKAARKKTKAKTNLRPAK
jgi:hypothetical protein